MNDTGIGSIESCALVDEYACVIIFYVVRLREVQPCYEEMASGISLTARRNYMTNKLKNFIL